MANLSFHFKYITDTCVYITRKFPVCIKFVRKVMDRNTHLTCTYLFWISKVTQTFTWTAPISYQITFEDHWHILKVYPCLIHMFKYWSLLLCTWHWKSGFSSPTPAIPTAWLLRSGQHPPSPISQNVYEHSLC